MKEMNSEKQKRFEEELVAFLREWNDERHDKVLLHTSGSTGKPKPMWVEKQRMMNSARMTCSFLGLKSGDSALLCMPLRYIAGKMVVVRSLLAGLELWPVAPDNHPLKGLKRAPVFAAMIPMQVYSTLQVPEEAALLRDIHHLIIGGGAVDNDLAAALANFPHAVWSTYGMTETLSHIALRRLNGKDASAWYTPFDGVTVRLTDEGTLAIHAPMVCEGELMTNDIAELNSEGGFRIIGRKDNVINSGGVKIQIEEVEDALRPYISRPFRISAVADAKFGQMVVMLIERATLSDEEQAKETVRLKQMCVERLEKYACPKQILHVSTLPLTETGKPDRAQTALLAESLMKK